MDQTVWIVNEKGRFDYSQAQRYGSLQPLLAGEVNVFNVDGFAREVQLRLRKWRDGDHLLLTGHPLLNWAAIQAVLCSHDVCPVLVYGARDQDYVRLELRRFSEMGVSNESNGGAVGTLPKLG